MTDLDDLAALIGQTVGGWNPNTKVITSVAQAIINAGWTPPPTEPKTVLEKITAALTERLNPPTN